MWAPIETWQWLQLQRLSCVDRERAEQVLNTLWSTFPGLYEEMSISAVDQEMLSIDECAMRLSISPSLVEEKLLAYRRCAVSMDSAVVRDETKHVARLAQGQIAVWEVVREYRKLGSVERLTETFPGLSEGELAAALRYAETNSGEIECLITEYENVLAKRRAEYPFAR